MRIWGFSPLFPGSILLLLIDAALIAHVIKTGRNQLWIWAIFLVPGIGALAYVLAEILPELFGGRTARRATAGVRRMIDPNRELRRASAEVEISGNVDARRRLGEELFERNQFGEAIDVFRGGLKGIFEHDPTLLLGLARAQFGKQDYAAARATLELLAQHNPDFKSADARLLYARTLDAQDALDEAEREYAMLAPGYPGAEARLRYGLLLKRRGKFQEAQRVLKDLLDGARLGPAHYRKAQAEWLDRARRELS
ncbi:MAG TPA: tetratricopeptide repeat protein [Steroidobacteraceae bacterium]